MTIVAAYIKPVLILSTVPLIWNEVMRFSFWEGKEKRVFISRVVNQERYNKSESQLALTGAYR